MLVDAIDAKSFSGIGLFRGADRYGEGTAFRWQAESLLNTVGGGQHPFGIDKTATANELTFGVQPGVEWIFVSTLNRSSSDHSRLNLQGFAALLRKNEDGSGCSQER